MAALEVDLVDCSRRVNHSWHSERNVCLSMYLQVCIVVRGQTSPGVFKDTVGGGGEGRTLGEAAGAKVGCDRAICRF